ncbi:MAG: diguanylate cyclase [Bdellovibrionales bacterium]|nr:diguanylate cyclase [Bdellovibrionales bacterium]
MKQWVKKLLEQFDMGSDPNDPKSANTMPTDLTEDRATILFLIDTYSKHLIEIDARPTRKVRAIFDEFAKGFLKPTTAQSEKLLFRFRQFFAGYRIQEYTYLQKTFEDFKGIIWDFADQLNESVRAEQNRDAQVRTSLDDLREAVEANSIDELKEKSREFIDFYIELQNKTEEKRNHRLESVRKNLAQVKKKFDEASETARRDHLTGAYNRKRFDEITKHAHEQFNKVSEPTTLLTLDIDYFKKINDVFGHDAGDHVLKDLVQLLFKLFKNETDAISRVGGEEFAIVLPQMQIMDAVKKAEEVLSQVRNEVIIHNDVQIRFTVSIGIAQLGAGESLEAWIKRSDQALYKSKESGRDQYTVSAYINKSNVA